MLAAAVAGLLADYYFTPPPHLLRVERLADVHGLAVYLVAAVIVGTAAGTAAPPYVPSARCGVGCGFCRSHTR
ncbi:DUF4118 domain-containing protein [Streptomyces sp. NBC_01408]|uniref:DUF4118 domain-containing protein n=1 Tax=Streptomyces sp. NBC_01408 TaxID=2903855 RepID=UPI002258ABDC|nr:DUF4118 domain-containing protein [Streptomyces sp. NBC_01408]MCX4696510.1 DUF4118 domain-containing protein [Streptomyces sp. NBC_01408]